MSSQLDRIFENAGKVEIDPVCGMSVKCEDAPGGTYEHMRVLYYFCADSCRVRFSESPDFYLENIGKHGH